MKRPIFVGINHEPSQAETELHAAIARAIEAKHAEEDAIVEDLVRQRFGSMWMARLVCRLFPRRYVIAHVQHHNGTETIDFGTHAEMEKRYRW